MTRENLDDGAADPDVGPRPRLPRAAAPGATKRRVWNFEGALPLLLVGGALLVYAAILANQEMPLAAHRLPFYALVGGVGAVVAGAGVYSTFLQPEPEAAPTIIPDDWVVISRAEWEESRAPRRASPAPPPAPPRAVDQPPWWEGAAPPAPTSLAPVAPPPSPTPSPRRAPPVSPPPSRAPAPPAGPVATPRAPTRPPSAGPTRTRLEEYRKEFPKEFLDALSELEEIAHRELQRTPPAAAAAPPSAEGRCVDCERKLPANDPSPNLCGSCGRGLCLDCALSSQREDGDLRCIECRVRSDGTPDPTIASRRGARPGVR